MTDTTYFRSGIWSVTDYGVEADGGFYDFEASRLTELQHGEPAYYDWPLHIARKGDCGGSFILDDFLNVWLAALSIHKGKYQPAVDPIILKRSLAKAKKIQDGNNEYDVEERRQKAAFIANPPKGIFEKRPIPQGKTREEWLEHLWNWAPLNLGDGLSHRDFGYLLNKPTGQPKQ